MCFVEVQKGLEKAVFDKVPSTKVVRAFSNKAFLVEDTILCFANF